jgi:tRNA(Ile)-lysidine synthase
MLIRDYGFTADQAEMIHRSLQGQPGKRFYSKNHELNINRNNIEILPISEITSKKAVYIDDGISLITSPIRLVFTKMHIKEVTVLNQPPKIALVDQELLLYPLTLRRWKQGDSFQPFGMKGKKLLSDFLTDQHYTIAEKANSYVLTDMNDNIIWIAGKRIDNRYRISANTSCVLKVELID